MNIDLGSYKYFVTKGLTPREVKVAYHVVNGLTNKEISNILFVSEGTVKYHVTNIYRKFKVASRSQFVAAYWKEFNLDK